MPRRASIKKNPVQGSINAWGEDAHGSTNRAAEELPLRRDMVTLLEFVRDNKVVGTQSTGSMPLKAVAEVTSRFVHPPPLEQTIGGKVYRIRSEQELWPLHYLRMLAEVGGLLRTGRARSWQLTANATRFLEMEPARQAACLLTVWWHRVNWLVAFPFSGMGDALPYSFPAATLAALQSLPVATNVVFDDFADTLITDTGLTWTAADSAFATDSLRSSIRRMVIDTLTQFGALECQYRQEPAGRGTVSKLATFEITPFGASLLSAVAASARTGV